MQDTQVTIDNVKWADDYMSSIVATINGQTLFIPNDMANRHRCIIERWVQDGNVIGEFE